MDFKIGYHYLTVNGQLRFKKVEDIEDPLAFFEDTFIKRFWLVQTETDYIDMIVAVEQDVYTDIANKKIQKVGA